MNRVGPGDPFMTKGKWISLESCSRKLNGMRELEVVHGMCSR